MNCIMDELEQSAELGDKYMYVFDDIKRATTLSNSEIATIVQDELSCEFEDIYLNESYFEFKLEKSNIG